MRSMGPSLGKPKRFERRKPPESGIHHHSLLVVLALCRIERASSPQSDALHRHGTPLRPARKIDKLLCVEKRAQRSSGSMMGASLGVACQGGQTQVESTDELQSLLLLAGGLLELEQGRDGLASQAKGVENGNRLGHSAPDFRHLACQYVDRSEIE